MNDPAAPGSSSRPAPKTRAPRAVGRTKVLTRDEIIAAAVEIADRGDLRRLTMRHLADALQVRAMSLYARVADKDEILDGIIEHRLRASGLPEPGGHWFAWMCEVAERLRRMLVQEPALLDRYCRRPVGVPAALERMEASLAVLRNVGFTGPDAVEIFASVHTYTIGFAALESARHGSAGVPRGEETAPSPEGGTGYWPASFAALDPGRFPNLVELRPDLAAFTGAAQFRVGLETLLGGLAARVLGPAEVAGDDRLVRDVRVR